MKVTVLLAASFIFLSSCVSVGKAPKPTTTIERVVQVCPVDKPKVECERLDKLSGDVSHEELTKAWIHAYEVVNLQCSKAFNTWVKLWEDCNEDH